MKRKHRALIFLTLSQIAILIIILPNAARSQIDIRESDLHARNVGAFYQSKSGVMGNRLGDIKPKAVLHRHLARCLIPTFVPSVVFIYAPEKSPDQFHDPQPTFKIVLPVLYQPSDVQLVHLSKSNHMRELRMSSGNTVFHYTFGVPPGIKVDCDLAEAPDGVVFITPKRQLTKGEYLIVVGRTGSIAWDFGIY